MTDFTPKQLDEIREVIEFCTVVRTGADRGCSIDIDKVIAELTNSGYDPDMGEVCWMQTSNLGVLLVKFSPDRSAKNSYRPLTPDEVPGWKRDKEKLKITTEALRIVTNSKSRVPSSVAEEALKEVEGLDNA